MDILQRLIDDYFKGCKFAYSVIPMQSVLVDQNKTIDLGNDYYVLVSNLIDIPVMAKLIMSSPDNHFETSRTDFMNMSASKYQFFSQYIDIELYNYGVDFTPFTLDFLKIVLTPKENEKK